MKKLIPLLFVLAVLAGVGMANLGERRVYPLRPGIKYLFTDSRDPNNWWDDVNDVYILNGMLEVYDVNVAGDLDVNDVNIVGDLTLESLTASRLLYLDSDSNVASVADFTDWIAGTGNEIDVANDGDGTVTIGIINPLIVAKGGTGAATLSDGFVLLGNATSAIQALDVTTDGGIIIGDGTTDPVVLDVGSSTAITILGTVATGIWQATDVGIAYGGTGQSTAQLAINALSAVSGATDEHVLTKDTATGNAIFKVAGGGLTEEEVEDFVGGMLGGTETHIAVTYQDASNNIDFVVSPSGVAGAIAEGELADSIIVSADIKDGEVTEADLNVTNTPGAGEDNYVLTYNHAGTNFTWAVDAGGAETDPIVGAVTGIIKADGGGNISAATANTDYEPALTDEASLYTTLSDVTQFYEAGDKVGDADTLDTHDTSYFQVAITGTDTHVMFFDGANTPAGEAGMTYNKTTNNLTTTTFTGALTGNASGSSGSCTGNSATATLAATVTYADNESTNETNAVVFLPGGDLDGGNLAPEVDGDFHYNPSTGTVTTTQFVGGGAGVTSVDAITGDSATAFFDAGTIEHEWGGLQADISAYTGLIAITGADTTAEIDDLSELTGQLTDVTRIVTEAVMPVAGTDPDVDAAGELSIDTDGANEPNDVVLRSIDGGNTPLQIALAQQQKSIQATIIKPNDLADATRDACPLWSNETGMSFVVTKIEAWADTDDTAFNVEVVDADGASNNATVDAVNCTTGAGPYTATETTITANTIAANRMIFIDFDDTDDPGWVKVSICGYYLSDVD